MAATTASEILHQTTSFISEILDHHDLRHSIFSTLRSKIPPSNNQTTLKPLNLASETLENAISATATTTTNLSIQFSSLRLAKKLLLSYPQNPFSSFLFSLICHFCNQPINELERNYEEVPDENEKWKKVERNIEDQRIKSEELGCQNGRYNAIRADSEKSVEFFGGSSKSKPSFFSQRISLGNHSNQNANVLKTSPGVNSDSDTVSSLEENSANYSSSETDAEETEGQIQKQKLPIFAEASRSPAHLMADAENPAGVGKHTPPKDFVCPITTHIFDDPVTLETGQTYERRAIQEWIERGNATCPITRQKLHSTQLPKTNYVLKRLIGSWQQQYPASVLCQSENSQLESETMSESIVPSTSPNSVTSQAAIDGTITGLRHAITNLCLSEILRDSEMAVLQIERLWQEANMEVDVQVMLSKPPVINGFVEILINSVHSRVLQATVFLLSELGSRDKSVIHTLTRVESDVECIVALFKKGLHEAVVLLYLLGPSTVTLIEMDMMESLLTVIKKNEEDFLKMCLKPKSAAVLLLGRIIRNSEESIVSSIASTIVSSKVFESVISSLGAEWTKERIAAVGILLRCMQEDGKCRNAIADKAELAPVLESFMAAKDEERFEIVYFLSELVKLNRRTFNEQILRIIKDEGTYSTMHTLLIYLQTANQDHCPVVAGLLLQLDLLAEPRKMSIYREEAIDTLISCLRNSGFPAAQIAAAETIMSLQGGFTASGKPLTRATLLKRAGLGKSYKNFKRTERLSNISGEIEDTSEEEKAADDWERQMAFVLTSHEFGLLFEALAEGLKSRNADLYSACFESATWLIYMLKFIPDTGILGAARICLLKCFISIFKSTKDTDERALSLLALNSFIHDPEGLRDLNPHMKDIMKGLRELRKSCPLAFDMLKVLSEGHDSNADFWNHKELIQVDSSKNGEVLSLTCFRDKIFSGHLDGTIKVWTGRGSILHLIQEIKEHTKAVTSFAILQSEEILYSGSLDKTARVWSIGNEAINCVQVHDIKDQIQNLVVANSMICFIPQGAGIKVQSWNGGTKLLNSTKYPKCLTLVRGRLYCGCEDGSIQEIDLATGTFAAIQSGHRKLLGKANPIRALQVHNGLIYSASSGLDDPGVKIWNASNYNMVGSLPTTLKVRAMAISSELVYLGCKGGAVEIWDQKKQNRIETLHTGKNGKVQCMALDENEEYLVIGTSDGRIQAWGLS